MQRLSNSLKNLSLLIIAVIVCVMLCEIIARFLVPVKYVGPSFTNYDSFYGKWLKKNFSAFRITSEYKMRVTINSNGFRGPEIASSTHPPIIFFGDSFTMGYGVNDGEEFPELVRKALADHSHNSIPVINAGMAGNGNGRWVKFLRTEARTYNPGLVILQFCSNDFKDNIGEGLFTLDAGGALMELPVPPHSIKRSIQAIVEKIPGMAYSHLVGLGRQAAMREPSPSENSADLRPKHDIALIQRKLLFKLLEEALKICREKGWPVIVLLVDISGPDLVQFDKFLSIRHIPTIPIPTKQIRPELYYTVVGHWNTLGHRFVADRILETIARFDLEYW